MLPTGVRHCQGPHGIELPPKAQREGVRWGRRICRDVYAHDAHVLQEVVGVIQLPAASDFACSGDNRRAGVVAPQQRPVAQMHGCSSWHSLEWCVRGGALAWQRPIKQDVREHNRPVELHRQQYACATTHVCTPAGAAGTAGATSGAGSPETSATRCCAKPPHRLKDSVALLPL